MADTIVSHSSCRTYKCNNSGTCCDSEFVIYCLCCPVCNMQYIGQSRNLRLRINNHRSDFKHYKQGNLSKTEYNTLYQHFAEHKVERFTVQILDIFRQEQKGVEKGCEWLNSVEKRWIWKLETIQPKGLNTNDGFYCHTKKTRK